LRKFEFKKLPDIRQGMGNGKYWSFIVKEHGRAVFTEASIEHWTDLPKDPWNDDTEEWDPEYDMSPPDFDSDSNIP
jgi:hypothetical protein